MFLQHKDYWSILTSVCNSVLTVFFVSFCLAFFSFLLYLNCMFGHSCARCKQFLEGWSCDPHVLRVLCMFTGFLCSVVKYREEYFWKWLSVTTNDDVAMETEEAAGDELIYDGPGPAVDRPPISVSAPSVGAGTEQNSHMEHVCCPLLVECTNG